MGNGRAAGKHRWINGKTKTAYSLRFMLISGVIRSGLEVNAQPWLVSFSRASQGSCGINTVVSEIRGM